MIIIQGEKQLFESLNIGDIFSLSEKIEVNEVYPNYIPYFQIKVRNSYAEEFINNGKDFMFNAISLEDGRVRTFHSGQTVYKFNKKEILLK